MASVRIPALSVRRTCCRWALAEGCRLNRDVAKESGSSDSTTRKLCREGMLSHRLWQEQNALFGLPEPWLRQGGRE